MNENLKWLAENVHDWKEGAIAVRRDGLSLSQAEWFFESDKPYYNSATRSEWQAARDERSGKPGWELAPEGAKILVQRDDGVWLFGTYRDANPHGDDWIGAGLYDRWFWDCNFQGRVLGDWRNTLERRSEAESGADQGFLDRIANLEHLHDEAAISPLRQFALSQILAAADCCITDDDVREVFINLITELDDEALAGVAGMVVK